MSTKMYTDDIINQEFYQGSRAYAKADTIIRRVFGVVLSRAHGRVFLPGDMLIVKRGAPISVVRLWKYIPRRQLNFEGSNSSGIGYIYHGDPIIVIRSVRNDYIEKSKQTNIENAELRLAVLGLSCKGLVGWFNVDITESLDGALVVGDDIKEKDERTAD